MTLYADMLFLVNFIMNTFVLWVVAKVTHNKRKFRWLLLGAGVMSALYTILVAFMFVGYVLLASVLILAVGLFIAFGRVRPIVFFKLFLITYGITFVVGGAGMALFYLTDLPHAVHVLYSNRSDFFRAISWQLVLGGATVSYALIRLGLKFMEYSTLKRQLVCAVQIHLGTQQANFDALVDTGHSLKDPLNQNSVIIAEFEQVKEILPDGLKVLFYEKKEDILTELITSDENTFYKRIRMIPFTSLGKANGMLIGFRPDAVKIEDKNPKDIVVGIYNDKLCKKGRYQGLLSPEIIS